MSKKNSLDEFASSLIVQKHQLESAQIKLSEMDDILQELSGDISTRLNNSQTQISEVDDFLKSLDNHLYDISSDDIDVILDVSSETTDVSNKYQYDKVDLLDELADIDTLSWEDYQKQVEQYKIKHSLHINNDPFQDLMTTTQRVALEKRIKDEFSLKNAKCDKYDYMIAGTCGLISGLIDILFVGAPGSSTLGELVDNQANNITEKFAEMLGWDKEKSIEKGTNSTASAIGYLEKKFKVNYDQATTHATGGIVENLSLKNHHLKSLGHSPDIIGLFFSILNQFTNTSSFLSNGELITIDTNTSELNGNNFIAKIFCGFANWFGHIMSDWTGSSGTVGQGGRGTGVPIPFFNLFQLINIGEFGKHKQTFAVITSKVFEEGYDARHGIAMAIPVMINELLIRFMYTMKAKYYHHKEWLDALPKGGIPEVRRMLLVGHGTLCLVDGVDASVRSGGEIISLLLRLNLIAWTRFGYLALKEINAMFNTGKMDHEAIDAYLSKEFEALSKYRD